MRFLRSETVLVLLALGVLLCVVFYDVVFFGRTLLTSPYAGSVMGVAPPYGYRWEPPAFNPYILDPGASAWQYEPLTAKASQLYRQGRLPLWNANQGFGAPLAANMHSSAFYFPAAPLLLWPTPLMWDVYLLSRLLLAGLFSFLFLRAIGVGRLGAFGAAVAFMLSGYFLLWVNASWLNVDALVPALLYATEKVIQAPSGLRTVFLALVVCAAILGGMPESTFVVLLFAGAYGAFRIAMLGLDPDRRGEVPTRAMNVLVGVALGAGASAFLLLPFLEYVRDAQHVHTAREAIGLRYWGIAQSMTLFVPYPQGPPLAANRVPAYYTGVVVPVLSVVAVLSRPDRGFGVLWFFLAAAGLAAAKVYGIGLNWVGTVPVFNLVDFPKHLGVLICFAAAVLAGFGLDALVRGRVSARRAVLATIIVQAVGVVLLLVYIGAYGVTAKVESVVSAVGAAAALLVVVQLAFLCLTENERRARAVAACCVALILVELVHLAPKPSRPRRHPADTPPPAMAFVHQDREPFRIFAVDGVLYPNTSSYFNLSDIRALDALYPTRYVRYVREFINPSVYDRFTGGHSSGPVPEVPTHCGANRWFDLLGVKYIFAPQSRQILPCEHDWHFIFRVLERSGISPGLRPDVFAIGAEERPVLFQHPPSEIRVPLRPDALSRALSFSVGLHPKAWAREKGDGVLFEVGVVADGRRFTAFSRWVDPKNDPGDRRWIDGSVDLSPYLGQEIELVLSTQPGGNSMWDWAGWAEPRLGPDSGPAAQRSRQYALVWGETQGSGRDLKVYRNARAFPRAFIVRSVVAVPDAETALRQMKQESFDPARVAVLEGLPAEEAVALQPGPSAEPMRAAEVLSYEDSQVTIRSVTDVPGALVLTDIFYPGWQASLDGEPVPMYPANYAFRGVVVPAGEHLVEFAYRPMSFRLGSAISIGSLTLLLGFVWISGHWLGRPVEPRGEYTRPRPWLPEGRG